MQTIQKYFSIFVIYYKDSVTRDLVYRVNFILGIVGAFVFVLLNYFLVTFLFQHVSIGSWNQTELMVFLGNFYIVWYAIFFFFYRGFIYLTRYIRDGLFDYYLIRPVDTQFLVSVIGGGIYNLLAIIFGFGLVVFGLIQLQILPNVLNIMLWLITIIVAVLDCYSFILMLVTLNFRFGYMEEIVNLAFTVQEFSRYPIDAFARMPIFLLVFALPSSAVSTIPTILLIKQAIPLKEVSIFLVCSVVFIFFVRRVWLAALHSYTSFA